jgi:hypothetical protein
MYRYRTVTQRKKERKKEIKKERNKQTNKQTTMNRWCVGADATQ